MQMQITRVLSVLATLLVSSCVDAGPTTQARVMVLTGGQSITVGAAGNGHVAMQHAPKITAPESGYLFIHSTFFPSQARTTDVSGVTTVYIFVPKKFISARKAAPVRVSKADGLQAFEFSQNDAAPEDYCFQQFSEGWVSVHEIQNAEVVIDGNLKVPAPTGPTDARCDASEFAKTGSYPLTQTP